LTEEQTNALEALRQRFLARSADDLQRLRGHLGGRELAPQDLRLLVHRLAGAAGTFGFLDLGGVARDLDGKMCETALMPADLMELTSALGRLPAPQAEC